MVERSFDERDVRVRANSRGSRPRTKQRPEHADAHDAMVTGVDRGRYHLLVDIDTPDERHVLAMKARELGRDRVVPGDVVAIVGDISGRDGSLARIVRIHERTTTLRRTADDDDPVERIIVANAHQLVVVTALADPEPRTGMIDRCVAAGYDAGMDVLLALTKSDLADAGPLTELYEPIGVRVVVTGQTSGLDLVGLATVREALAGRSSVFVGHSGVGKSTLVNALVPDAHRAIGRVNEVTGRGRHTSSSAISLRLPAMDGYAGGWVIDTPGVRSFGLAHVQPENLLPAFADLADVALACPRGCTHMADAPDCGLDEWVRDEWAPLPGTSAEHVTGLDEIPLDVRAQRVDSFRRLLESRSTPA